MVMIINNTNIIAAASKAMSLGFLLSQKCFSYSAYVIRYAIAAAIRLNTAPIKTNIENKLACISGYDLFIFLKAITAFI